MGLAADSRRRVGNKVPDSRDIRQMDTQVCPPDSLFAENAPSVRDLPLVKQNFIARSFIMIYHNLKSPRNTQFLRLFFMYWFIVVYAILYFFGT